MPEYDVNYQYGAYSEMIGLWEEIALLISGEKAVKAAGTRFVPMLSGQDSTQYAAYIQRGSFFNAIGRTSTGFHGAIMREDPQFQLPSALEYLLDNADSFGNNLVDFVSLIIAGLVDFGYCGVLVDIGDGDAPYFAMYSARDIINVRTYYEGGIRKPSLIVLKETDERESGFGTDEIEMRRVLGLDENGQYYVQRWMKTSDATKRGTEWVQVPVHDDTDEVDFYPAVKGARLDFIPFAFFGAVSNTFAPPKPPLLDLAYLNIKHWQVSVDYYHGLHFCGLPTPYAIGVPDSVKLGIGPSKIIRIANPEAKLGILEYGGEGLSKMESALDRLEGHMAIAGARILMESQKRGVEAAEALRIRYSGDTTSLMTIISNTESGVEKLIAWAIVMSASPAKGEVMIRLNRKLVDEKLSPQDITALLQALQARRMSQDTFLYNLANGGILPPNVTIEDEKTRILADSEREGGPNFAE